MPPSTLSKRDAADGIHTANDFALVDSHCHLDFFLDDHDNQKKNSSKGRPKLPPLVDVLARAYRANIRTLLTVATDLSQQTTLLSICQNHDPQPHDPPPHKERIGKTEEEKGCPRLFCSAGTHPTSLNEGTVTPSTEQLLTAHHHNPSRIIAFGESGLDFFRANNPPAVLQYEAFHNHILAAQEAQIPLIIHNRNADIELERILTKTQKTKPYPCILHCFAATERLATVALELDCTLSFAGLITYPSARALDSIVERTPLRSLLLETDSPFLPPQSTTSATGRKHRAPHAEPAMLTMTAKHIASVKGLSLEELATTTSANFASLFCPQRSKAQI